MSGPAQASTAAAYQQLRPLLFSLAYRMLGSVSEAEDMVQEAFARYQAALAGQGEPASPKAYLCTVVTRLCIDQLRSARARRESYAGEWLPEPLLTGPEQLTAPAPDPAAHAEQADSLSMAFLLLLERLSPLERAVFLLHDVFGYDYEETARTVGRTAVSCRQVAHRARQHMAAGRARFDATAEERVRLAARFFGAVEQGDVAGLAGMLAADAEVHGDGGGTKHSWGRAITGREHVSRLLGALGRQLLAFGGTLQQAEVNGQPGALALAPGGDLIAVLSIDIAGGQVQTFRSVINPDKLRHLGPLADLDALAAQRRRVQE